ncbi:MAG: hypothetical protein K8J09_11245 [Planctomycetes bacterium]|nr:hypothetical protein [Planctomycetota bacterium]MCC7399634.1 hypothetical protein [Planctomycetota bacterium]
MRIVDIGSWHSPVAQQHGVQQLPWLWLYDKGELVSKDTREVIERLQSQR